eukprot:TRINITY_DN11425_c0_g1_i2.p1 TRINITY_DN11425_c0_g1~~TRINITY_DN11425_c0_g1_i2.p1  ORF type:complete len:586 (+),score=88.14 TRINITY_DN11425_c0_g1_i2:331-2088(+)
MLGGGIKLIVESDFKGGAIHMGWFAAISVPASIINSSIRTLKDQLAARARVAVNKYLHDLYLKDTRYYDIAYYVPHKDRIIDTHQRVVSDLHLYTNEIFDIFVNGFKPFLDVVLYSYKIKATMGIRGLGLMWSYFIGMFAFKEFIAPSFSALISKASVLEGEYSAAQQRVTTYAEEIAFFRGEAREKYLLNEHLSRIFRHTLKTTWKSFYIGVFDNFVTKYAASVVAYFAMALPILFPTWTGTASKESLAQNYTRNSQYLLNLANGVKNLAVIRTRVSKASGRLVRLAKLLELLIALSRRKKEACEPVDEMHEAEAAESSYLEEWKAFCDKRDKTDSEEETAAIEFKNVAIVSPDNRLLIEKFNLKVERGKHLLITGPNGTGKSSIFRVLGGLWPVYEGEVTKCPEDVSVYFLTQNPYFVTGNMREQIIYPLSLEEALAKCQFSTDNATETENSIKQLDSIISKLMDVVDPAGAISRDFSVTQDWFKVLSGGQRQLISMVRLAFHRPVFALLDECTSAVDIQKDSLVFQICLELGITMLSISHKHRFHRQFHDFELRVKGGGEYELKRISDKKKQDSRDLSRSTY